MFDLNAIKKLVGGDACECGEPHPPIDAQIVAQAAKLKISPDALRTITMLSMTLINAAKTDDQYAAQLCHSAAQAMVECQMRTEIIRESGPFARASDAEQVHRIANVAVKLPPQEQVVSEEISAAIAKFVRTVNKLADNATTINAHAMMDLTNGHATILRGLANLRTGVKPDSVAGPSMFDAEPVV